MYMYNFTGVLTCLYKFNMYSVPYMYMCCNLLLRSWELTDVMQTKRCFSIIPSPQLLYPHLSMRTLHHPVYKTIYIHRMYCMFSKCSLSADQQLYTRSLQSGPDFPVDKGIKLLLHTTYIVHLYVNVHCRQVSRLNAMFLIKSGQKKYHNTVNNQ